MSSYYKPVTEEVTKTDDGITVHSKQYAENYFSHREPGQTQPVIIPPWAVKVMAENPSVPADVQIMQQAIDLITWEDGALWCTGALGKGEDGEATYPAETKFLLDFIPHDGEDDERTAEFRHLPVTQAVCAVGSIQLLMGVTGNTDGSGGDEDYATIVHRLNKICASGDIVSTNDGTGREAVVEAFKEYVRIYGGSISAS
jgi:hypothetical protein